MKQLTKKQQQIYDFILKFKKETGYPPSVREIADAVGLKSPSTVHFHLKGLAEAGMLVKDPGKPRALTPVDGQGRMINEETDSQVNRVPVIGNVAAGSPILAEECIEDYLTFDTGGVSGEHFALRVRGESMLNAGILPGDLVVVQRQQTFRSGEIVVALFEDEATVKTLQRKDGHIWLMPENPEYQPIDGDGAELIGRVVAVVRRY